MGRVLHGARYNQEVHFHEFRQMDTNRSGDVESQEWLNHFRSNAMLASMGQEEYRSIMGRMNRAANVAKQHFQAGGGATGAAQRNPYGPGGGGGGGGGMGMGMPGGGASMMGPMVVAGAMGMHGAAGAMPGGQQSTQGLPRQGMGQQPLGMMGQTAARNAYGGYSMGTSGSQPSSSRLGQPAGFTLMAPGATAAFNPYDMQRMMALADAFTKIDLDANGTISKPEFMATMRVLYGGTHAAVEVAEREFTAIDMNGDGEIDKAEFTNCLMQMLSQQNDQDFYNCVEHLAKAGAAASKERIRLLNPAQQPAHTTPADRSTITNMMVGSSASSSHAQRMLALEQSFSSMDGDGDGLVSLDEFFAAGVVLAGLPNTHFDKQSRWKNSLDFTQIDKDMSGDIDRNEWLAYYMNLLHKANDREFYESVDQIKHATDKAKSRFIAAQNVAATAAAAGVQPGDQQAYV